MGKGPTVRIEGFEEEVSEVSSEGSDQDEGDKVAGLMKNFTVTEEASKLPGDGRPYRCSVEVKAGLVKDMVKEKDLKKGV